MKELERIGVLEDGLMEIRRRIELAHPNGAPELLRELTGLAADALRKSDEIAVGRTATRAN